MPFTVNVGPYKGGDYLFQGLSNLGAGIGGGIEKAVAEYKKTQEEQGQDQILLNFYQNQGMVTPDIMNDYTKGSHSAKTGIIAGLSRQYAAQQQQAQEKRLQDEAQSMMAYRKAQINAQQAEQNFIPRPPMQFQTPPAGQTGIPYGPPTEAEAAAPKVTMIETSPGKWKEPEVATGEESYSPTGKSIPVKDESGKTIGYQVQTGPHQAPYYPDAGRAGAGKVMMTINTPDGPQEIPVTGNALLATVRDPVKFKSNYGVTQSAFSDPTQTQYGNVDPATGEFQPDVNGTWVQYGVHIDPKSGMKVVGGTITKEEHDRVRTLATQASKAIPTSAAAATPTPAPAAPTGRVRVADKDGKVFTVPANQLDQAIAQGYKKL